MNLGHRRGFLSWLHHILALRNWEILTLLGLLITLPPNRENTTFCCRTMFGVSVQNRKYTVWTIVGDQLSISCFPCPINTTAHKTCQLLLIHMAHFLITLLPGSYELLTGKCPFMILVIRGMILCRQHSKCFYMHYFI